MAGDFFIEDFRVRVITAKPVFHQGLGRATIGWSLAIQKRPYRMSQLFGHCLTPMTALPFVDETVERLTVAWSENAASLKTNLCG